MTRVDGVMGVRSIDKFSIAMALAVLGMILLGCATQVEKPVEEQAGARAIEWADALIDLDYQKALTYMTPAYQESPRAERFRGDYVGSAFWQKADLKWVKCDEGQPPRRCSVRLIITFMKPPEMSVPTPIPYDTTWLFVQGNWFQYKD